MIKPILDQINLVCGDLDMTDAGYQGLQPPWDAFWGARYAVLEDPSGIAVGLMSPISREMNAPPPKV